MITQPIKAIQVYQDLIILLQVEVANKYVNYHAKQFGYSKPNTDFRLGEMEHLSEVGIQDNSMDIIM